MKRAEPAQKAVEPTHLCTPTGPTDGSTCPAGVAGGIENRGIIYDILPKTLLLGLRGLDIDDAGALRLHHVHLLL